ncbi:MAG TPA: methionyl-tRNA formyltransferase [Pirellulales bacterium]|nr:methionyl-tRNA formyltransferase [Pirellulales bacterium]
MGTGPSAVPSFEFLLNSQHQVLALITRPERTTHHREKPTNPMREIALRRGIVVFEPESINSPQAHAWLCDRAADLFVVCDYGQILSQETLALARMGGINLHASLLPKFRGAAPINWAIYHGEAETGVTVIHMTPQLDAGPTLVQFRTPIGPAETAPELESRLATLGVGAIHQSIELLAGGAPTPGIVQDPRSVTKAPRLKKEDGLVDWSRSAVAIYNQVRALQPWPKTYTFWKRPNSEPLRLILEIVQPLDDVAQVSIGPPTSTPGTIQQALSNQLIVACGKGSLRIDRLQPAGKRIMTASEFLRGHALLPGEKLG